MTASDTPRTVVSVTASSVQVGDVMVIAGERFEVRDLATLQGGLKRLTFTTGESLTLRPTRPFRCERPLRVRRYAPGRWSR